MRRLRLHSILILGSGVLITLGLFILAGCGGGGGPQSQPLLSSGPSPSAQFIALLPAVQRAATPVGSAKCAECHKDPQHDPSYASWQQTVHAANNVGCESCHGAGSVHVANPSKTNILTGADSTRPAVCGQCHGPVHDQFQNSRHASFIQAVIEEGQTNPKTYVATCFRCHSAAFRTAMIDEPLALTGKTVSQVDQATKDAIDANIAALTVDQLGAFPAQTQESATCVTCHDPHRNTGNLSSEGKEQYLRRATFSTDTTYLAPGTAVKNYTTIDHMCGTCHNGRGANNTDTAIKASNSRPPFHEGPQFNMLNGVSGSEYITSGGTVTPAGAPFGGVNTGGTATSLPPATRLTSHGTAPNQCVHCHMPQQRHTFTVSLDTSCSPCHTAADAAARQTALKAEIINGLVNLKARMENWSKANVKDSNGVLLNDPDQWDYTSNITADVDSNGQPKVPADSTQKNLPGELKRARHNYWLITKDHSYGIHNSVYVRYLLDIANKNMDALGTPRSVPERSTLTLQQKLQIVEADVKRSATAAVHDL